jgi:hypothetical protein
MDHTFNSRQAAHSAGEQSVSRRSFIRYLSMGSVAVAVQACGGGGGAEGAAAPLAPSAPTPAPVAPAPAPAPAPVLPAPIVPEPSAPSAAPVWLSIPTIAFTQGVPSSFSVADYITVANVAAYTLTLNGNALPAGVTFNAATRSFDYDGRGAVGGSDGLMLTAVGG